MKRILFLFFLIVPSAALGQELTEADFIKLFTEKNPQLAVLKLNPKIASEQVRAYKGQYDLMASLQGNYALDQSAQPNTVFGTDNRQLTFGLGLSKKFAFGLESSLSWQHDRVTTDSPFATLSPYYTPSLVLNLRQHLLKNQFGLIDRKGQESMELEADRASLEALSEAGKILTAGLAQFWELKSYQSLLDIDQRFLKAANEFKLSVQTRKRLGTAETSDWLAAQALVLERENEVTQVAFKVQEAREEVARLLQADLDSPLQASGSSDFQYQGQLDAEIKKALQARPDFLALKKAAASQDLQVMIARNSRLPTVDLVASLEANGIDASYGAALEDSFTMDHRQVMGGLEISLPLQNRTARATLQQEQMKKQQLLLQLKDHEQKVIADVRAAYRNLQARLETLKNLETIDSLLEQKWKEELKKFAQGRSNSDTVIRFEREHLAASWNLIEARHGARMAWIDLRLKTGDLMELVSL